MSSPSSVDQWIAAPSPAATRAVMTSAHSSCDVVEPHSIAALMRRPGARKTSASPTTFSVGDRYLRAGVGNLTATPSTSCTGPPCPPRPAGGPAS